MYEVYKTWTAAPQQLHAQQEQCGCYGECDWEPISELFVLVTQQGAVIQEEGLMIFFYILLFFPMEGSAAWWQITLLKDIVINP